MKLSLASIVLLLFGSCLQAQGPTLDILRTKFRITSAEINPYQGLIYGVAWSGDQPHETNLHVTLKHPNDPSHFQIATVFPYANSAATGVESFLSAISSLEKLYLSVPWLKEYLKKHPETIAELEFVQDRSFSLKAQQNFAADMHLLGKDALVAKVKPVADQSVLLNLGLGGWWILLPDRTMILWRYESTDGLLAWRGYVRKAGECSSYITVAGGCVGAVVSASGDLHN